MTAPLRLPPGFHADVPAAAYHADCAQEPSLSSSLARVLVAQTPRRAFMGHPRLNQAFVAETDEKFDLGSAAHDFLASGGAGIGVIHGFADWKKAEARSERERYRAAGLVPLLEHQFEQVAAIGASVALELAERKIDLGHQESVLIAQDRGVWLRAMIDSWAPPWISDFKITKVNLANDRALARHMVDMGYDLRAAFYIRVAGLVFPKMAGRIGFRWLMVEEDEPHGMRVIEADGTMIELGRRKVEHAIGLWSRCTASGHWPHLEGLPRTLEYPAFQESEWLERETRDGFVQGPMATLRAQERESLIEEDAG